MEQLLSIVHWMEILSLVFAGLALWGVTRDWPAPVSVAVVMVLLLAGIRVLRYSWGWVVSLVLQAALLALGFWEVMLFILGLVFIAVWIFCFRKARQLERGGAQ